MSAKQIFNKALLLLDRGQMERGEACLREAISLGESEPDELSLAGALCALGELLLMQERGEEAVPFLERVIGFERDDDLIDYEQSRARELLHEVTRAGDE